MIPAAGLAILLAAGLGPALARAHPSQGPSAAQAERAWTLLIYGAADNNADGPIQRFLDDVRRALDDDPGMELVLFIDRAQGFSDDPWPLEEDFTGARLYRLTRDSAERLAGGEHLPELGLDGDVELDSGDPATLRKFLAFGKARFPARRTGLLIYGHADGRSMCPDEQSQRSMGIAELTDAIGPEGAVDFLALELCSMGGAEIAYQWRPGNGGFQADVLVAIPNIGPPLDWDRAFARIRSPGHAGPGGVPTLDPRALTAESFARLVVEEGEAGRKASALTQGGGEKLALEAAAAYDLSKAGAVKRALDALAVELHRSGAREAFEKLRGPGASGTAMNYCSGRFGSTPFVDLFDLCRRAEACEHLDAATRAAAARVRQSCDDLVMVSFGMPGYEGFQAGCNGVFVAFPDGKPAPSGSSGSRGWRICSWYTPLPGSGAGERYGRWSFCGDGAIQGNGIVETWFELLDAWFDAPDGGGANGYRV